MNVKRFSSIVFLILIGVLFLTTTQICEKKYCEAAVVWTDNFDDGDISDWSLELGSFSVADGSLRGEDSTNAIKHASTVASGTWSFDTEIIGMGSVYVSFLAGEVGGGISTSCYCLRINPFDIQLLQSTSYQNTLLDSYDPTENIAGWVHIEITRDTAGHFAIAVNGTQQLEVTDTTHGTSNYFVFYCNANCAIDNIEISDSVTTTTSTNGTEIPVPPGIPGFPLAAISLGLLIVISFVLIIRHRRAGKTD